MIYYIIWFIAILVIVWISVATKFEDSGSIGGSIGGAIAGVVQRLIWSVEVLAILLFTSLIAYAVHLLGY